MSHNLIILLMISSSLHMIISTDVVDDLTGDSYIGSICFNSTKEFTPHYAQGVSYAVEAVCSNAPKNGGFYQTTQSDDPSNRVFALGLCRGDISSADCSNCLNSAAIKVVNDFCFNETGAIIWRDYCLLKYSDVDFIGNVDVYNQFNRKAGELVTINATWRNTMAKVIKAVENNVYYYFGYVKADVGAQGVYAMAQCTRDVNASECRNCIIKAYGNYLSDYIDGYLFVPRTGARSFMGSCTLRYETSPFSHLKAQ